MNLVKVAMARLYSEISLSLAKREASLCSGSVIMVRKSVISEGEKRPLAG